MAVRWMLQGFVAPLDVVHDVTSGFDIYARPASGVRDSWPQAERAPSRGRDLRWRSRLAGARAAAVGVLAFLRGLGNEG